MAYNVVLITGIPGAGKSTISNLLANRIQRSVLITGDDLRKMVKGGYKSPSKKWDEETHKQYYLSFKNCGVLVGNFLKEGYKVIIDDALHAGNLYQEWAKYLEQFKPLKVLLKPSKEIALTRNRERTTHFVDEKIILEVYDNFIQHKYDDWFVIDNGGLKIEETVTKIQSKLGW